MEIRKKLNFNNRAIRKLTAAIFAALMIGAVFVSMIPIPEVQGHSGEVINSPMTLSPPTIDGVFTPGEWIDAVMINLSEVPANNVGTVMYVMNDNTALFILYDAWGDTTDDGMTGDTTAVGFDTNHDGVNGPNDGDDDYFGAGGWFPGNEEHWNWTAGFGWTLDCSPFSHPGLSVAGGFGVSPNSPANHMIYEWSIPLNVLGVAVGDTLGFAAGCQAAPGVADGGGGLDQWPVNPMNPIELTQYGNLILGGQDNVRITPKEQYGYGWPGQDMTYTLTINNSGINPDLFDLTWMSSMGWGVSLFDNAWNPLLDNGGGPEPDTDVLPAKTSMDIYVVISIPTFANLGDVDITSIQATSSNDPAIYDYANMTTGVQFIVNWSYNFEAGWDGWTSDALTPSSPPTNWEVGMPAMVGPPSAYSPPNCAGTNIADDYYGMTDIVLKTPYVNLTEYAMILYEDFESPFPPAGWSVVDYDGFGMVWLRNDATTYPNYPTGSGFCADANSDALGGPGVNTGLRTPPFSLVGYNAAWLEFDMSYEDIAPGGDFAEVNVSTDGGFSWTSIAFYDEDHMPFVTPGEHVVLDLSPFLGQPNVIVEFHYDDDTWDWYWQIDNVTISALYPQPSSILSFYTWYEMDTGGDDGGFVELSVDGGPWFRISPVGGYPYLGGLFAGYGGDGFSDNTGGSWDYYEFDLSAYSGQTVQARFHFVATYWFGGDAGWYIDDVSIGVPPPYGCDLTPDLQGNFSIAGTDVDFILTVNNTGSVDDTYDLSYINNILPWTVTFRDIGDTMDITNISVSAGNSANFIVRVTIPPGASEGDFDYTTITASSQNDSMVYDQAWVYTAVNYTAPFFDNFDPMQNGWSNDTNGMGTEWQLGDPSGWGPGMAFSGINCWGTNIQTDYGDDADIMLHSPSISIPSSAVAANLSFMHWFDIESDFDGGFVEINNGTGWQLITPIGGYPTTLDGTNAGGYTNDAYGGFSGGWVPAEFDISAYIGDIVIFRFIFASDGSVTNPGWYIDDMGIYLVMLSSYDVDLTPDFQGNYGSAGQDIDYTLTVDNTGTNDDTYDLTYVNLVLPWTVSFFDLSFNPINQISVASGNSEDFIVRVSIPGGASPGDFDITNITVTSQNDSAVYDYAHVFTTVNYTAPFFDDFDPIQNGWWNETNGMGTEWQLGDPSGFGPGAAYSGSNCWGTNIQMNYGDDADVMLHSPSISIPSTAVTANLSFMHWYNIESNWDGGFVEINNGMGWQLITPIGGYPTTLNGFNAGGYTNDAYGGLSGGWLPAEFDLGAYIGEVVMFRFIFASDGSGVNPGWYIDDVGIYVGMPFSYDVNLTPDIQRNYGNAGQDIDYTLTVNNTGTNDDTYDLAYVNLVLPWPVSFFDLSYNPITQISVASGNSEDFIVRVRIPGGASPGDLVLTNITVTSQNDSAVVDYAHVFTAVYYTAPFFDNFDPIQNGWWNVTNGMGTEWQLGDPSGFGPGAAYSGINCWGTNIQTNYGDDADVLLYTPPIFIPAAALSANLTFWHWFEINDANWDGGFVQINTGMGWQLITSNGGYDSTLNGNNPGGYTNDAWGINSGGIWINEEFDLSAYIGQVVTFRFIFASDGIFTDAGWYIDDVGVNIQMPGGSTATATAPIGGPTNVAGITIQYSTTGSPASVDLWYTTDTSAPYTWVYIDTDSPADGSYGWTITSGDGSYGWFANTTDEVAPGPGDAPQASPYIYDSTQPEVESTDPANAATGVLVDQNVVITFNESINTTTFSYTIEPDPGGLSEGWGVGDTVVTISHNNFALATRYWVNITGTKDLAGNDLNPLPYSFYFDTTIGTTATATGPTGGPTNVAAITIQYSTTGGPASVDLYYTTDTSVPYTWNYIDTDSPADGSYGWMVSADGTYGWLIVAPDEIAPGIGDAPEASPYIYDGTQPEVDSTNPVNAAVGVPIDQDVVITFNESINTTTFTYTIEPDPGGLSELWGVGDTVVTISHNNFALATRYWVNITGTKDLAGNDLNPLPYSFYFDTDVGTTATATGPIGGPTNVAGITIQYSTTGSPTSVDLWYTTDTSVPYTWIYIDTDSPADGNYFWTITSGDGSYGWFANTTDEVAPGIGDAPEASYYIYDSTQPEVESTDPIDTALGVPVNKDIIITFNESINITTFTYTIEPDPGGLSEVWNVGNTTVTISHNNFALATRYYVNITAAKDLAGNDLNPLPYSFYFNTSATSAVATGPIGGPTNVALITITYNPIGGPTSVDLWYTKDTSVPYTWVYIDTDNPADGIYVWTITAGDGSYGWFANSTDENAPTPTDAPDISAYIYDSTQPEVDNTNPINTATGVPVNLNVVITFNESLDNSSFTYTLEPNPGGLSEVWNVGNTTVTISHIDFTLGTRYWVNITAAKDLAGNDLNPLPYSFYFDTPTTADATGPIGGPTNVAGITITYDVAGSPATVDIYYTTDTSAPYTWTLIGPDSPADGSFGWVIPADGEYGWFIVSPDEIAPGSGDAPEASIYIYDGTQPQVDSTNPVNAATGVLVTQVVVITFNESINTSTFSYTFEPDPGGLTPVWSLGNTTLTISHTDFALGTRYWVNITAAKDLAGNDLNPLPYSFYFDSPTTADATGPIGGPTNVAGITIAYDVVGSPATVDIYYTTDTSAPYTWTLIGPDSPADGSFGWVVPVDGSYGWFIVSPDELAPGIGDSPEASAYIYDGTPPEVDSTNPVNTATGVLVSQAVIITFNESMNTSSFTYTFEPNPGGLIPAWNIGNTTVTISHLDFASLTQYWVNITALTDMAGNNLNPLPYSFYFETEFLDLVPPNASGVPIGSAVLVGENIIITFSEQMDTASVENAFSISPSVTGSFSWNGPDTVLTFIPSSDLTHSTTYTVTINGSIAEDLSGNTLDGNKNGTSEGYPTDDYSWSFTTETADTTPPTSSVSALSTYGKSLSIQITYTAEDGSGSGVKEVELWFKKDSGDWFPYNTYSGGSRTVTFTADSDGVYYFYTKATDNEDNPETAPPTHDAKTTVDTTNPTVDVGPDVSAKAVFTLTGTASDDGSDINTYSWTKVSGPGSITFGSDDALSTTVSASQDGTYVIRLTVTDNAGNSATDDFTLVWDTTSPAISSSGPTGTNISVSTTITITFSEPVNKTQAENAFSITPSVTGTFSWNTEGTVLTFTPTSPLAYSTEYNVTLDASGIVDGLENAMQSDQYWTFTTKPAPPGAKGGISGRVLDEDGNPIEGATVTLEGTSFSTTTDENGNYSFTNVPVGTYTINVEKDGYETETKSATVTADQTTNVAPTTLSAAEEKEPDMWWLPLLLIIIVVVIVLVVLMFLLMRKKKEPEGFEDREMEEPPPPPPQELPTETTEETPLEPPMEPPLDSEISEPPPEEVTPPPPQ